MKTLTKLLGTATILATLATTASATDINPTLKGGLLNGKSSIVAGASLTHLPADLNAKIELSNTQQYNLNVNKDYVLVINKDFKVKIGAGVEKFRQRKDETVTTTKTADFGQGEVETQEITKKETNTYHKTQFYLQATISTNFLQDTEGALKIRGGQKSIYTALCVNQRLSNNFIANFEIGIRKNYDSDFKNLGTFLAGITYNF